MNWVVVAWSAMSGVCAVLALIHFHVWIRMPARPADGAFALLSASVSSVAAIELAMMHAASPQDFSGLLRVYGLALLAGFIALVLFTRAYLGAGSRWVGGLAILVRILATVVGLSTSGNLHFSEVEALVRVSLGGVPVVAPLGKPNPWMVLGSLSVLLLVVFFVDAIRALWRRGRPDRALTLAGALLAFVLFAMTVNGISVWMPGSLPLSIAVHFVPVVLIAAAGLGRELARSAGLSRKLLDSERRLEESRRRLSLAADAACASFWQIRPDTGEYWATHQTLRLVESPDRVPTCLDDLIAGVHPDDRSRVRAAIAQGIRGNELMSVEYRLVDRLGEAHWVRSMGRRHVPEGESVELLAGVTIDIGARRRAEEKLLRQREEMERLSRVLTVGALSSSMAHELRQPLAIVMASAETGQAMLRRDPDVLSGLAEIVADTVTAAYRASNVIERLRSLLRTQPPRQETVRCDTMIPSVLDFLRTDLTVRGVRAVFRSSGVPRGVVGDPALIEHVIINLVMNASEAMSETAPEERELTVELTFTERGPVIEFLDRGHGLPERNEQVFDPLFSTKSGRLGMGLTICRTIAQELGGSLTACRRTGGGAVFRLELPSKEKSL